MKQYTGTKTIKAKPMTFGEYRELRGSSISLENEPSAPGYLVEYQDGGKANHPDFQGYISWSPADVFENAYRLSETPADRLKAELEDLVEKVKDLAHFMTGEEFKAKPDEHGELIKDQLSLMMELGMVLDARIQLL
jgi:hypothetical protein